MADINLQRREAEALVHMSYGQAYGKAMDAQAGRDTPEARKQAAAAMLAERTSTLNTDPQTLNRAEANAGRAAMVEAYGEKRAADKSALLSGRVTDYDLPKGFGGTQDMKDLVGRGQDLVERVNRDAFASRGFVNAIGPGGKYMELAGGRDAENKDALAKHMLHVKSSIDAAVDRKVFDKAQGESLYQRFERSVYDPEAQKQRATNPEVAAFAKAQTPRIGQEVSKDVQQRYDANADMLAKVREREAQENKSRADAFKNLPKEEALKKHPELSNAFVGMEAAQLKVAGQPPEIQRAALEQVRNTYIKNLENGQKPPEINKREEREVHREQPKDLPKDKGQER